MISITQTAYINDMKVRDEIQFDTIEEYIAYCEFNDAQEDGLACKHEGYHQVSKLSDKVIRAACEDCGKMFDVSEQI